jgi:hypothetical protein
VRVVRGAVDSRLEPRPRARAQERDAVVQRRAGDTRVDGRVHDLAERAERRRSSAGERVVDDPRGGHPHAFQHDAPAERRALAERVPVLADLYAGRLARHVGDHDTLLRVEGEDGEPLRGERAGGVVLVAVQHVPAAAVGAQPRDPVARGLAAAFGERVAEPRAAQELGQEVLALLGAAVADHGVDEADVILGDLRDRRVGDGDQPEDLRDRGVRHAGAAGGARDAHAEEPRARELAQLLERQGPVAVARDGPGPDGGGVRRGRRDRLLVGGDHGDLGRDGEVEPRRGDGAHPAGVIRSLKSGT